MIYKKAASLRYDKCVPMCCMRAHKSALTYWVYAERKCITRMCRFCGCYYGMVFLPFSVDFFFTENLLHMLKVVGILQQRSYAAGFTRVFLSYAKTINFIFQS